MLIKQIYRVLLLALLGLASCTDDDGVGTVQRVDLLDFEFHASVSCGLDALFR